MKHTYPVILIALLFYVALFAIIRVARSPVVFAQESITQMSLAASGKFQVRLVYLMLQQARTVKAESQTTVCHAARTQYADQVIDRAGVKAAEAAAMIVGGVNLIGPAISGDIPEKMDTAATDGAIFSQIGTFWNALAKCDTGS